MMWSDSKDCLYILYSKIKYARSKQGGVKIYRQVWHDNEVAVLEVFFTLQRTELQFFMHGKTDTLSCYTIMDSGLYEYRYIYLI